MRLQQSCWLGLQALNLGASSSLTWFIAGDHGLHWVLITGCWISCHMNLSTGTPTTWPLASPGVSSQPVPMMEAIVFYGLISLSICSWSLRLTLLWGRDCTRVWTRRAGPLGANLEAAYHRESPAKWGFSWLLSLTQRRVGEKSQFQLNKIIRFSFGFQMILKFKER